MRNSQRTFTVAKEHIHLIKFAQDDVITNKIKKKERFYELTKAAKLGNLLRNKVSIYFRDANNKQLRVNTTVWAVTKKFVILKNAKTIPLQSILAVE